MGVSEGVFRNKRLKVNVPDYEGGTHLMELVVL